jgi:hypothetical protein
LGTRLWFWGENLLDSRYLSSIGGMVADLYDSPVASINRGLEAGIDFK